LRGFDGFPLKSVETGSIGRSQDRYQTGFGLAGLGIATEYDESMGTDHLSSAAIPFKP
jgi:hypothetical protein